jgi:hypothetical protein
MRSRASWFRNLFDARVKIADWRKEYNEVRPHSSLDYRTPDEFARAIRRASGGKDADFVCLENASGVSHFPSAPLRDKFIRPTVRIVGAGQAQARRFPRPRTTHHSHRKLYRRTQPQTQALYLDSKASDVLEKVTRAQAAINKQRSA